MRKIFAILTALMLVSCSMNHDEVVISTSKSQLSNNLEEQARKIVLNALNKIDPATRGSVRTINRIETITYEQLFGSITRSDSTIFGNINPQRNENNRYELPLLQIAIFDNNSGYAVLTPLFDENDRVDAGEDDDAGDSTTNTPIKLIALVDSGTITSNDIITYTNNNTIPDNYLSPTDLYDEEDEDFLIGGSEANEFVASVISSYLYNKNQNVNEDEDISEVDSIAENKVGPLLQTKWWQELPFNYYIHTYNAQGAKRPVGCCTTATAQILTYFKNRPLDTYFNVTTSSWSDLESGTYTLNSNPTDTTHYNAARIMKVIADGIGVKYNYSGKGETFATPKRIQQFLENTLDYNVDRQIDGSKAVRLRRIVSSLNDNKPVIMAALGGLRYGHAWVVDGYMKNEDSSRSVNDYLIHCNFGWAGNNDGWYFINILHSDKNDNDLLDPNTGEQDMKFNWLFRYLFFN